MALDGSEAPDYGAAVPMADVAAGIAMSGDETAATYCVIEATTSG
jgi:hypothetical protein